MESDIILEGFNNIAKKSAYIIRIYCRCRYFKKLQIHLEWGENIKKVDCLSYIMKNINKNTFF